MGGMGRHVTRAGPRTQFYEGATLPDDVPEDELARLAEAGMIEAVPDDAASWPGGPMLRTRAGHRQGRAAWWVARAARLHGSQAGPSGRRGHDHRDMGRDGLRRRSVPHAEDHDNSGLTLSRAYRTGCGAHAVGL